MWTALAGAVIPIVLKEGLNDENIEKVADFLIASGKKLGSKAAGYLKEWKQRREPSGNAVDGGIPAEVKEEMLGSFRECLESRARDVYMGGVAFFSERPMDEEAQETLAGILTNINEDTEPLDWEDEADAACQQVVDGFMWKNYGRSLNEWEGITASAKIACACILLLTTRRNIIGFVTVRRYVFWQMP